MTSSLQKEILNHLSKIIDPLGFIAPVVIRGKILIQKLWQSKVTWDEPLSDDLQIEWKKVATDLNEAKRFTVSRWYFDTHVMHPSIHCFADASQHTYGALVFFVQGKQVSFVIAKARVAPLKVLNIPRLELMATLVGARLTKIVLQAIPPQFLYGLTVRLCCIGSVVTNLSLPLRTAPLLR